MILLVCFEWFKELTLDFMNTSANILIQFLQICLLCLQLSKLKFTLLLRSKIYNQTILLSFWNQIIFTIKCYLTVSMKAWFSSDLMVKTMSQCLGLNDFENWGKMKFSVRMTVFLVLLKTIWFDGVEWK